MSNLQQPDCLDCGNALTEVRPGKHQCDWCELTEENGRLRSVLEPYDEWFATKLDFALMEKLFDEDCSKATEKLVKASIAWHDMGQKKAAQRCAEIAIQNNDVLGARAIRKEFGIER